MLPDDFFIFKLLSTPHLCVHVIVHSNSNIIMMHLDMLLGGGGGGGRDGVKALFANPEMHFSRVKGKGEVFLFAIIPLYLLWSSWCNHRAGICILMCTSWQ